MKIVQHGNTNNSKTNKNSYVMCPDCKNKIYCLADFPKILFCENCGCKFEYDYKDVIKSTQKGISLWSEGYAVMECRKTAQFLGFYEVETLKEAVIEWLKEHPEEEKYVDMERLSYWGCRFFDNEMEARRSFG